MSKRGKASVPKTGPRTRPRPTKHVKQSSNGRPRTANKDTGLLLRKGEVREDVGLIQTAIANRWPVPASKAPVIVRRLLNVVRKESVGVVTKRGEVVDSEALADTNSVLASRVLVQMLAHNQREDFKGEPDTKHEHQHIHIHDANGNEQPIDPEAEQRRARLLELATSWRARGLVIDGVTVDQGAAGGLDRNVSNSAP